MRISSGESLLIDEVIFYRFPAEPNLLLASPHSKMGEGYPIAAIVCLAERIVIRLGDATWGVQSASVDKVRRMLNDPQWQETRPANEVRLISGDMNFAHHVWNELSALQKLVETVNSQTPLAIDAAFQPLGPLAELLPELLEAPIASRGWSCFDENKPGRAHVFLGGTKITAAVRKRVQKVALNRAATEWRRAAKRLAARHAPVVWLSVRSANRTAINQREVLVALCKRLFALYPRAAVILDGYSLPDDFTANSSYDRKSQREVVARDLEEAAAVAEATKTELNSGQDLVVAVGLNVLDFVVLADAADFYVCHHGTVQHKIGWLAAKPGVVHTNPRALRRNHGPWVSDQMEDPPSIFYIPETLVREYGEDLSRTTEERSLFLENYEIVDVEKFVDFVIANLSALKKRN